MAKPENQGYFLLINAPNLKKGIGFISALQIQKSNNIFDFIISPLDVRDIKKQFVHAPKEAQDALKNFGDLHLTTVAEQLKAKFKLSKSGVEYQQYLQSAKIRNIHWQLIQLKPFFNLFTWYHRVEPEKGRFLTRKCSFSVYRPTLFFEIVRIKKELLVETWVEMNGAKFPIFEFKRHQFLLESGSEYFILNYADYTILEWLEAAKPLQYKNNPTELLTEIIHKLEEHHTVNRNHLYEENIIESKPIGRVLLSEISNAFLMLTPQWVYDGILVEGEYKEQLDLTIGGNAVVLKRNKEAEQELVSLLVGLHPNFLRQYSGSYNVSFAEAQKKQWFLKVYHKLLALDIQVVGMDLLRHFRYSPHKAVTTMTMRHIENERLMVAFSLSYGDETVPLAELQKTLLAGQKVLLLKDGSLGLLDDEWVEEYGTMVKHGKVIKTELEIAKWMVLNHEEDHGESAILKTALPDDWWGRWVLWQSGDGLHLPVPQSVSAQLRPYQQKGFEWMSLLAEAGGGACLADDMGLGKTLQTICLLAQRLELYPNKQHLIVCPTSLIYNWMQELSRFAPSLKPQVFHGPTRNIEDLTNKDVQVWITSYGTLRSDIEAMSELVFDMVVLDESHNIKNPSAQITRAVVQLRAASRVALSGTPVINNTFDLYAQLSFLLPGMFGSRDFFKREYADAIDRNRDPDKIKALQKLTAPFILRRTKEQVAPDLPAKTESILWCVMGTDQYYAYQTVKEKVKKNIFLDIEEKGLEAGKLSVMAGLTKLRMLCDSCELVTDEDLFTSDSIKTEMLIEELQQVTTNHKALVFSQFTKMLDLLEASLVHLGIAYCRLDGSTPMNDRQKIVNQFQQKDGEEKVFLISLKAGNAGLNLTAAEYVFLVDPWWNKAVEQQAIDRTHRIGQQNKVFAYKLICKGTIEEKILQLQQRKKALSDDLIGGEESFIKNLSQDDLLFLFS